MLHCNNCFARAFLLGTQRQARRLAKFADELSGTRHFKVPLYPIEGHLNTARGPTDGMADKRQGAALSRILYLVSAGKAGNAVNASMRAASQGILCGMAYR
jgi:hypothetical protein